MLAESCVNSVKPLELAQSSNFHEDVLACLQATAPAQRKHTNRKTPMFNPFKRTVSWKTSGFADLPRIPSNADVRQRDDYLIAGGLALVLSRCPPEAALHRFKAAYKMYEALKKRNRGDLAITRELVSDVSHEVAEFTGRATRNALGRRMRQARS